MKYEYVKGETFISEEHMLSCTEIAQMFGICYSKENSKPYGRVVTSAIKDYVKRRNLKTYEFYYIGGRRALRVYPSELYLPAMKEFIFMNKLVTEGEYTCSFENEETFFSFYFTKMNIIIRD